MLIRRCSAHRRGLVVGVVMVIMLLVGVLVVSIGFMNAQTLGDVAHSAYMQQALDTAQAGLQAAQVELKLEADSGFWDGNGQHTFTRTLPLHTERSYQVTLTDNRSGTHATAADGTTIPVGWLYASSVGRVPLGSTPDGATVRVGGTFRRISLFRAAAFVSDHLEVAGGSVTIDGKIGTSRSSPLPAPIPITLQSLDQVTGSIIMPSDVADYTTLIDAKKATAADINAKVDPSIAGQPYPAIAAPTGLTAYPGQTNPLPKTNLELTGNLMFPNPVAGTNKNQTLKLHAGTYYFLDDVTLGGNVTIELQGDVTAANPVKIYVAKTWDSSGCSITGSTDDARKFQIYGTETATSIALGGTSDCGLLVYIRNGDLTIKGSGHLFGSFVGKTVHMTGTGQITFDTEASQVYLEPAAWELHSWTRR